MICVSFTLIVFTQEGEIRQFVIRWIAIDMVDFGFSLRLAAHATRTVRRKEHLGDEVFGDSNPCFYHQRSQLEYITIPCIILRNVSICNLPRHAKS